MYILNKDNETQQHSDENSNETIIECQYSLKKRTLINKDAQEEIFTTTLHNLTTLDTHKLKSINKSF